ncbi:MAG: hypothetical protein WCP60_02075 [bacterium]
MISSPSDPQTELLQSIATSLKGIHSSLDRLTEAVEGVAESIETAHEPEGDLGHHLVGALKDISIALHKRAQQERLPQPQHRQHQPQYAPRRDERSQQRNDEHGDLERPNYRPPSDELDSNDPEIPDQGGHSIPFTEEASITQNPQAQGPRPRKPHPNRRRGGAGHGPKQVSHQATPAQGAE